MMVEKMSQWLPIKVHSYLVSSCVTEFDERLDAVRAPRWDVMFSLLGARVAIIAFLLWLRNFNDC